MQEAFRDWVENEDILRLDEEPLSTVGLSVPLLLFPHDFSSYLRTESGSRVFDGHYSPGLVSGIIKEENNVVARRNRRSSEEPEEVQLSCQGEVGAVESLKFWTVRTV